MPTVGLDSLAPAPPTLTAVPQSPILPWMLLVGALFAVLAAWRHPRVTVTLALVLLLGVFAFENALHSVHHGFDQGAVKGCAIAAASAQLAATTVDAVTQADLAPPPTSDRAVDPALTAPAVRFLCPDQGRAPPA